MRRQGGISRIYACECMYGYDLPAFDTFISIRKGWYQCPFVYYIPEQDTEAMQKPMDAERLLRCLGASGKLAGFPCAAYMVEQVREDPERIRLITKRLYRETARKFRISPSSVERDLRTLIRSCWEQPDRSFLEHVAGRALSKPPTNSEFIDILAAFLRK